MSKPRLPADTEKAIKAKRRAWVIDIMERSDGDYLRPQVIADELGMTLISASGLLKDMAKDRILDSIQRLNDSNTSNENHYRIAQKSMLSTPWRKSYKWHPKPFYDFGAP